MKVNMIGRQQVSVVLLLMLCGVMPGWSEESEAGYMDFKWASESWKDDDKPFERAKQEIDTLARSGKLNDSVVNRRKAVASDRLRRDPLSQFKWVYSAYRLQVATHTPGRKRIQGNMDALTRARDLDGSLHCSFTYCRQVFLAFMMEGYWFQELRPASKRILSRNQKDFEVMFFHVMLLDRYSSKDSAEWVRYVTQLRRHNPNDTSLQVHIADKAYQYWRLRSKVNKDGQSAIGEYEKLLKMANLSSKRRSWATGRVALIKKEMGKKKKVGVQ